MRVLITTSTFPLRLDDGLPRFVYDLAEGLARHCDVIVLAPAASGTPTRERMGMIDVHRFRYFWPASRQRLAYGHGMRDNLRGSALAKVQVLTYAAAQTLAVRSLVRRYEVRLVNSHWMVPQGLTTALASGYHPTFRHVLSVHAGDVYLLHRLPGGRALARFVLSRSHHVFADGSEVRERLNDLVGHSCDAVVQPMGVRREVFSGATNAEPFLSRFPSGYLLFVGRFTEKKGVKYLLQAMPRVLQSCPGLGLILVGYGALDQELREEAARLGLDEVADFVGRKSHDEIFRYLRGCRAAVVPSIIDSHGEADGMPTVIVEAMATGTRVVASAVDGIPDVIRHGENGWLCREKDPEDLAEKILIALRDSTSSAVVRSALETAGRADWEAVATHYLRVFEQLTEARLR